MRTTLVLIVLLLGLNLHSQTDTLSFSQERKFKHSLSLNGSISFPLIGHIDRVKGEGIYKTKPFGGLKISYLYSTSYRFAIGMEFGANFMNVFVDRVASTSIISNNGLYLDFKGMDIGTYSFVPKFRWKTKKNNKVSGVYHEFGAGLTISKPIKKEYSYEDNYKQTFVSSGTPFNTTIANETYNSEQLYDYSHKPYLGLLIMYDLSYKGKITTNLLWSIGLRTQLNLSYRLIDNKVLSYYNYSEKEYFWISKTEMSGVIARNRFKNPFTLNFGLVYNL